MEYCDFTVWTPKGLFVERIVPDVRLWNSALLKATFALFLYAYQVFTFIVPSVKTTSSNALTQFTSMILVFMEILISIKISMYPCKTLLTDS